MAISPRTDAKAEWRAHWPVVLAAGAGYAASTIVTYSSSLFIQPMQAEFGWSRAQIMSGHSVSAVAGALCAPFTGYFVDRLGPRRLGIVAVIALCIVTALLGLTGASIWMWRAMWLPVAFAIVLIQPSVWTAAVTSLFAAGRGLALAAMLCGGSIASIVTPPLTYWLIEAFGWRLAWVGLATFWAVIALPLIVLFFTSAKDRQRTGQSPKPKASELPRSSVWESGILSLRYLQILVGGVLIAGIVVTLAVSIVPILSSRGIGRAEAAGLASLIGVSAIVGRLGIGTLLDRIHGRYLAALCVALPIVGISILIAVPGSMGAAAVAVLILGFSFGAELDIIAYLTSRYFPTENFGFLFGTIGGCLGLAAGNGPVLLSAVFDSTGSYVNALWGAIPICAVAALLFLSLGPYPTSLTSSADTTP